MKSAFYAAIVALLLISYAIARYVDGCGNDAVRIGGIVVASCRR